LIPSASGSFAVTTPTVAPSAQGSVVSLTVNVTSSIEFPQPTIYLTVILVFVLILIGVYNPLLSIDPLPYSTLQVPPDGVALNCLVCPSVIEELFVVIFETTVAGSEIVILPKS
jgi:hypothetical protein